MVKQQIMMIVSLLLAAIAIKLATSEEQLAWVRLPYHTFILTGKCWVMALLAGHLCHNCMTVFIGKNSSFKHNFPIPEV